MCLLFSSHINPFWVLVFQAQWIEFTASFQTKSGHEGLGLKLGAEGLVSGFLGLAGTTPSLHLADSQRYVQGAR